MMLNMHKNGRAGGIAPVMAISIFLMVGSGRPFAEALSSSPVQESSTRQSTIDDEVKEKLWGDEIDIPALRKLAKKAPEDVLRITTAFLNTETNKDRIPRLMVAIREMGRLSLIEETPPRVVEWARQGDLNTRTVAFEAASRIPDGRSQSLFIEMLKSQPTRKEDQALFERVIDLARFTGSGEVAKELNRLALQGSRAAIRSLAHIGFGADAEMLSSMASSGPAESRGEARMALEAVAIVTAADLKKSLLEALRRPPSPGGWLSWPDWALNKLEKCRLTEAVADIRSLHRTFETCPHALPDTEHYRQYWSAFRVRMLETIRRLGGKLSEDESKQVESYVPKD